MRFRPPRRLSAWFFVAMFASTTVLVVVAAPGSTQEDAVQLTADTTYFVNPEKARIEAEVRLTVRSVEPATGRAIGAVSLVLPAIAAPSISATRNGVPVDVVPGGTSGEFQVFDFGLGRELLAGQTAELVVRFSIVEPDDDEAESTTRINSAYVSFPARGLGDAGRGSVRVVIGNWLTTRWADVDAVTSRHGFVQTLELTGVGQEFSAIFEGRNDDALEVSQASVQAADVTIAGWPGDTRWAETIEDNVGALVPALEELIGEPWPLTDALVIRETNAGLVHGYDGAFVGTVGGGGEIELGPLVTSSVIAHELAHAWFDDRLEPWIAEGLAEEFGLQALESLGRPDDRLVEVVRRDDEAAVPLLTWVPFAGAIETDRYAYAASAGVVGRLRTELGSGELRSAVRTLLDGSSAYGAAVPPARALADWQLFLDAVETRGDSEMEALLVEWVLPTTSTDLLRDWRQAIDRLAEFSVRAGDWGVPVVVWAALTRWDFDTVGLALDAADAVLDERDRLAGRSSALGVRGPNDAQEFFADDPALATKMLLDPARGVEGVSDAVAAVSRSRGFVETIGLWGEDPAARRREVIAAYEAGDHHVAVARSTDLTRQLDAAGSLGSRRIAGLVAIVALFALAGLIIRLTRVRLGSLVG